MSNQKKRDNQSALDDRTVSDYLLQHPDFFIRNAEQMAQLRVPHPVRGSVSLVEWHMARARHQINELEQGIRSLVENANTNQHLFYRLLKLQAWLACASSLQDMLQRLQQWAREMKLAQAGVRLFSDAWYLEPPLNLPHLALNRQAFEAVRLRRFANSRHYLGTLSGTELLLLLPQSKTTGSVALTLLGNNADLGVLIFTSRDPQHYQPNQGTQLLQELALLLPDTLQRWLERKPCLAK